jgi:hypothetical protein
MASCTTIAILVWLSDYKERGGERCGDGAGGNLSVAREKLGLVGFGLAFWLAGLFGYLFVYGCHVVLRDETEGSDTIQAGFI